MNNIHQLPNYMKPCYEAVLDLFKEMEEIESIERSHWVQLAKEAVGTLNYVNVFFILSYICIYCMQVLFI